MSQAQQNVVDVVAQFDDMDPRTQIQFLHWAIEDTQRTIQFLDTKAAFCVTLMSGMVAVSLQHMPHLPILNHGLFPLYLVVSACGLLSSLRVIFPTARPHGAGGGPLVKAKFYIGPAAGNHWIQNTLRNPRKNIVSETTASYSDAVRSSADRELLDSMAETMVMISYIRQLKGDRLHSAMYCLGIAILLFTVIALASL